MCIIGNEKCVINLTGFRLYLIDREYSYNTIISYIDTVRRYYLSGGSVPPDKPALLKWKQRMLCTCRASSINQRIAAMRVYCRYAGVPCDIKSVRVQRKTSIENNITLEQYSHLVASLTTDGKQRWACYVRLLGSTGMRTSELLNVTKKDLKNGYMEMYTKGKLRVIFFPASVSTDVLKFYEKDADESYICQNAHGGRLTARGIRAMLAAYARKYDVPIACVHPHAFRHMFAQNFLQRTGNDIALLADILGHSSINTTRIYLQLSQAQQKKTVDKIVDW